MGYSKDIYEKAMEQLQEQRRRETELAEERRRAFYALYPRAQEIEKELSSTAIQAAKAVLHGKHVKDELSRLKEHNQALQAERRQLLETAGLDENALLPQYACPLCQDEGFRDGKLCPCLKQRMCMEACKRLNQISPLSLSTFDTFQLRYYSDQPGENESLSPREHMRGILEYCKQYAAHFSLQSPSLLFRGGTGLGKTHLSLAVAGVVLQKGYGVVYDSVHNILSSLEQEHFRRDAVSDDTTRTLLDCDLLILDDLGTEFLSPFLTSSIYNLINSRLMAQKPTIISTNLTLKELEKRYSERFVSRIIGNYTHFPFYGKDVRQQKRMARNTKSKPLPKH